MKKVLLATICLVAVCGMAPAVQISITADATGNQCGYVQGQSYTFTFDIGENYLRSFDSAEDAGGWINIWSIDESPYDHSLITNAGGTGLTGTFEGCYPQFLYTYGAGGLAVAMDIVSGLQTPDGTAVYSLYTPNPVISLEGVSFAPLASFADPANYFSQYAGTYAASDIFRVTWYDGDKYVGVDFDASSVTITPEPATMALLGLGALVLRRRRK